MSGEESKTRQLADMILDLQAFYGSGPPPCMAATSSDLFTDQRLFDGRESVGWFPDVPHFEYTVVPGQIFTPPILEDDWAKSFESSDTYASVSSSSNEIAPFPGLERPQDDKGGRKHRADLQLSRKTKHARQKAPMAPRVVPRNAFPCRYDSRVGKDCKSKYFKRKYHRDRHERTVHGHSMYQCWVRGCKSKPFTRTDNLRDHLKNTHGKKSHSGKYQYVATLDRYNIHYDPGWVGEISEDGLPRSI